MLVSIRLLQASVLQPSGFIIGCERQRGTCLGKGQRAQDPKGKGAGVGYPSPGERIDLRWGGYSYLGTSSHSATLLLQGCSATFACIRAACATASAQPASSSVALSGPDAGVVDPLLPDGPRAFCGCSGRRPLSVHHCESGLTPGLVTVRKPPQTPVPPAYAALLSLSPPRLCPDHQSKQTVRFRQYSLTDTNPLGKARNNSLRSPHHPPQPPPLDYLLVFLPPENEQTIKSKTTHQNVFLSHHLRLNGCQCLQKPSTNQQQPNHSVHSSRFLLSQSFIQPKYDFVLIAFPLTKQLLRDTPFDTHFPFLASSERQHYNNTTSHTMDDPASAWPFWKFGLQKDDLTTTLHDRFNTIPSAIQDPEAFHHDVYELSTRASTLDEFERLMEERKKLRLEELNGKGLWK